LDCQTEESALYTTLANFLVIPGAQPTNQAMLRARAMVDQFKAKLKIEMMTPPLIKKN
jgi:hypothetical protein